MRAGVSPFTPDEMVRISGALCDAAERNLERKRYDDAAAQWSLAAKVTALVGPQTKSTADWQRAMADHARALGRRQDRGQPQEVQP